jgi:dUTP pyrophosphatase
MHEFMTTDLIERTAGVLSREQLQQMIGGNPPLIEGYLDLDAQLQPNGFDLTLESIARHQGRGTIGCSNSDRVLPELIDVTFDDDGWATLDPGIYLIKYNETVSLPNDLMALGRPRSSLARSGVSIHTAVWDAGYSGRSTSLLHVIHPDGFRVERNARVAQLVFFTLSHAAGAGYSGVYMHENRG